MKFPTTLTSYSLHQVEGSERHVVFEVVSPSQRTKTDILIQSKNAGFILAILLLSIVNILLGRQRG